MTNVVALLYRSTTSYSASPRVGRWLARDPIGINGGINLYGYVKNQPLYYKDMLGLCGEEQVFGGNSVSLAGGIAQSMGGGSPGDAVFQDQADQSFGVIFGLGYIGAGALAPIGGTAIKVTKPGTKLLNYVLTHPIGEEGIENVAAILAALGMGDGNFPTTWKGLLADKLNEWRQEQNNANQPGCTCPAH